MAPGTMGEMNLEYPDNLQWLEDWMLRLLGVACIKNALVNDSLMKRVYRKFSCCFILELSGFLMTRKNLRLM